MASLVGCNDSTINKIQKLENSAMRIILGVPFVNDMLRVLGFMDIRSRVSYVTGCVMFKVLNNMAPSYLIDDVSTIM